MFGTVDKRSSHSFQRSYDVFCAGHSQKDNRPMEQHALDPLSKLSHQ